MKKLLFSLLLASFLGFGAIQAAVSLSSTQAVEYKEKGKKKKKVKKKKKKKCTPEEKRKCKTTCSKAAS